SLLVTLGVVVFGAVQAILLAVVLALVRFVRLVSRPTVETLGQVPGFAGFHSLQRHADATVVASAWRWREWKPANPGTWPNVSTVGRDTRRTKRTSASTTASRMACTAPKTTTPSVTRSDRATSRHSILSNVRSAA